MSSEYIGDILPQTIEALRDNALLQGIDPDELLPNVEFTLRDVVQSERPHIDEIDVAYQCKPLGSLVIVQLTGSIGWIRDYNIGAECSLFAEPVLAGVATMAHETGRRLISNPSGLTETEEDAWEKICTKGAARNVPDGPGGPMRKRFVMVLPGEQP